MNQATKRAKPATASSDADNALYEVRRKIYPRAVHGWFARWRVALVAITQAIFYGLPWLLWNGRQAVLFDLGARKFYIFGAVFWPQDFIFLAALLVIAALALFFFTAVAGRLFCGYACPQTVYTEIFLWVERMVEGDRVKQMRLDRSPLSVRKAALKTAKHGIWISIAFWTGFTFVAYFTPSATLARELVSFSLGPWETFWILFYGFATYGNAGWMREQVCKYMCPYARFQSVMFDADTLIITYNAHRGEPRGSRKRSSDHRTMGLGDCVDCGICAQVCPAGIDIRQGLQYECTGCTACMDACNQVMDKMGYTRGLIRYSTAAAGKGVDDGRSILRRIGRPRILVYGALLTLLVAVFSVGLYVRTPLKVDVIRDRAALARETSDGLIENVYRLQVMNTQERAARYRVSVAGLEGVRVIAKQPIEVGAASSLGVALALRVDPAGRPAGRHDIVFHVEDIDSPDVYVDEKSRFFVR